MSARYLYGIEIVILHTVPRDLPTRLYIAAGLDINKKNGEHWYIKYITYFLNFFSLLRVWSLRDRERVEEIVSAYGVLTRDLFTSTNSWFSALTSKYGYIEKHLLEVDNSHLVSHHSIFVPAGDTGTFCFWAFVRYFRRFISTSSHFSFECVTATWLNDQTTCHSLPISANLYHLYPLSF